MRIAALSLTGAACLLFTVAAANAAPSAPSRAAQPEAGVVQVAGGCGWGFHRNRWHRCAPNRYSYYRARPYWHRYYGGYYGGGYHGWSPTDNMAGQLNAQQLNRGNDGLSGQ